MIYSLYRRLLDLDGPQQRLISHYDSFRFAWIEALSLFEIQGFLIAGCHLSPEYPHEPAHAEFFVVKGTEHRTYFIQAKGEAK